MPFARSFSASELNYILAKTSLTLDPKTRFDAQNSATLASLWLEYVYDRRSLSFLDTEKYAKEWNALDYMTDSPKTAYKFFTRLFEAYQNQTHELSPAQFIRMFDSRKSKRVLTRKKPKAFQYR
jgi:hypothetical protein